MKTVLILTLLFFSFETYHQPVVNNCVLIETDLVLKQIIKNKPKIDRAVAIKLSKLLRKYAAKYKMDPHRAAAIAMQESGYRNVVNKNRNHTMDVGIFQVNSNTAKAYKFDISRLMVDMDYAVNAYFVIMKDKKQLCKNTSDSWACYHSKNPTFKANYKKLVEQYYFNVQKLAINDSNIEKF